MFEQKLIIPSPLSSGITVQQRENNKLESPITKGWLSELIEEYVSFFEPPDSETRRLFSVKNSIPCVSILKRPNNQIVFILGESHIFLSDRQAQLQRVLLRSIPANKIFLEGPSFEDSKEHSQSQDDELSAEQGISSELVRLASTALAVLHLASLYLTATDLVATSKSGQVMQKVGATRLRQLAEFILQSISPEENRERRVALWHDFLKSLLNQQTSFPNQIHPIRVFGFFDFSKILSELDSQITERINAIEDYVINLHNDLGIPPSATYRELGAILLSASLAMRRRKNPLMCLPVRSGHFIGDLLFLEEMFSYDRKLQKAFQNGLVALDRYLDALDEPGKMRERVGIRALTDKIRKVILRSRAKRFLRMRDRIMTNAIHSAMYQQGLCSETENRLRIGLAIVGYGHVPGIERQLLRRGWSLIAQFSRTQESVKKVTHDMLFQQLEAECFEYARLNTEFQKWISYYISIVSGARKTDLSEHPF